MAASIASTNIAVRRITKELQQLNAAPLDYIYVDYSDANITHLDVLFIGPRDSPYSRCFLRFTFDFPGDYPIKPPKVVCTSTYNRKIHPNVFPGGWVCLSTLNTGDASGWVPSINLAALLMTIYSMFTKEMIESSSNSHNDEQSSEYFPAVMEDTLRGTGRLLADERNPALLKIMKNYHSIHKEWYIRKINRLAKEHDGKIIQAYKQADGSDTSRIAKFASLLPLFA